MLETRIEARLKNSMKFNFYFMDSGLDAFVYFYLMVWKIAKWVIKVYWVITILKIPILFSKFWYFHILKYISKNFFCILMLVLVYIYISTFFLICMQ